MIKVVKQYGPEDFTKISEPLRNETEHFKFYCAESDAKCLDDLAKSLEDSFLRISTDLEYELGFKIEIQIYKDIETFHKAIGMDQAPDWVIGTADENKIKIVSPLNPGKVHNYQTILQVIVHEFTHVVVNNIVESGDAIPMWLHEGIATYEAEQKPYASDIRKLIENNAIPDLSSLESYNSIGSMVENCVYQISYTLVDYIINEYGFEKLNKLLRLPSRFNKEIGVDKNVFEQKWKDFMRKKYR